MKTILIPTDFSKNAFVAAEYGCALAAATGQNVLLLHVYIALYSGYKEEGESVKQIKWVEQQSAKDMESIVKTLKTQFPDVSIEGEYLKGFMIDLVSQKLKDPSISMVVMGTKGVSNVAESILGSTTYEVIKKSPVPVLVVPMDTADFTLARAGFFTDYKDSELDALQVFNQVIPVGPKLSVVHFFTDPEKQSEAEKSRSRWERKISAAFPDNDFVVRAMQVAKVDINAVREAADTERLDLLVFARTHRSFFHSIFAQSLTKAVAGYTASVPSMFIRA